MCAESALKKSIASALKRQTLKKWVPSGNESWTSRSRISEF